MPAPLSSFSNHQTSFPACVSEQRLKAVEKSWKQRQREAEAAAAATKVKARALMAAAAGSAAAGEKAEAETGEQSSGSLGAGAAASGGLTVTAGGASKAAPAGNDGEAAAGNDVNKPVAPGDVVGFPSQAALHFSEMGCGLTRLLLLDLEAVSGKSKGARRQRSRKKWT